MTRPSRYCAEHRATSMSLCQLLQNQIPSTNFVAIIIPRRGLFLKYKQTLAIRLVASLDVLELAIN